MQNYFDIIQAYDNLVINYGILHDPSLIGRGVMQGRYLCDAVLSAQE